jgi:hypothetical protein
MNHGPDPICRRNAPGALAVAIADTRERAAAIRRSGGVFASSEFAAEVEAIRQFAAAAGLYRNFEPLSRSPDAFGFEHAVWFLESDTEPRVLKATWPDAFGFLPDGHVCLPSEYLERLCLHNIVFGDDIRLEGIVEEEIGSCRIITSQPAIRGRYADQEEIERFFVDRGFAPVRIGDRRAWWRRADGILCADTHGGNILVTDAGGLAAIDVPVMRIERKSLPACAVMERCERTDDARAGF